MNSTTVNYISKCRVKPKYTSEEFKEPLYLTPSDLILISFLHIQRGLLFLKPQSTDHFNVFEFLEKLKDSLSLALVHFYPLAGRLATTKSEDPPSYVIYVDCQNGPGAEFIHAAVDIKVSDVVSPAYVSKVIRSFFVNDMTVVNHDGHTRPLLTVQVTELIDGIFIGCTMNHCLVDGTSFWHFFNTWSEIFQSQGDENNVRILRPPIIKRWFPEGQSPIINLPYTHHDQFLCRSQVDEYTKSRFFRFTTESLAKLKAKVIVEANNSKISSFQSLYALVWRSITRARGLSPDQKIICVIPANIRSRLNPPLSPDYFGNYLRLLRVVTTAGELLENNLGWAASLLHQAIVMDLTDKRIRGWLDSWTRYPTIPKPSQFEQFLVLMESSPRFSMYSCEFGLGKAVAIRSSLNRFDGKILAHPGYEGGGSVDLEICLNPDTMSAFESDGEILELLS